MSTIRIDAGFQIKKTFVFEKKPELWLYTSNTPSPKKSQINSRKINGNRIFELDGNTLTEVYNEYPIDLNMDVEPAMKVTVDGKVYEGVHLIQFEDDRVIIHCDSVSTKPAPAVDSAQITGLRSENENLKEENKQLREEIEKLKAVSNLQNNRQAEADLQKDIADLTKDNRELEKNIESLEKQKDKLTKDKAANKANNTLLNDDIANLTEENTNWKNTLISLENQKAKLEDEHRRLSDEYKNKYDTAILDKLKKDIEDLKELLKEAKEESIDLEAEREAYRKRLEAQKAANKLVQDEINAQPADLRKLQDEYERLREKLRQTQNAIQECSEEEQNKLREQIKELEPSADKLQKEYGAIKEQVDALNGRIEELKSKKVEELVPLWSAIKETITVIKENVGTMNSELDELENDVNTFNSSVEKCEKKLETLKSWYHADSTPLLRLLKRVSQPEDVDNSNLRDAFNIAHIERINKLLSDTDSNLKVLDVILKDVTISSTKDDKLIQFRSEANEARAQNESAKVQ